MDKERYPEIEKILYRLQNRREFMGLFGKGLGFAAFSTLLPACGGSSSNSGDTSAGSSSVSSPEPAIPRPSYEYTVLKRTSFGPHRDELASIRTLGVDVYLEQQLDHLAIDDSAIETEIATQFPLTLQTPLQLLAGFPDNIFDVALQMIAATQYRQMFARRQLFEIMVEFWSDHFNIHLVNGLGPTLKPFDDQQVIRANALGNFGDLLRASAKSSAMLFYLDNYLNRGVAPNENYARELMELHTLGVDGGYTETDVKEVARCFTGWTLRFPGDPAGDYGEFRFDASNHDSGAKLVLGQSISASGGVTDGEQVLDILLGHPSTARFIATKLCRRFISDAPASTTVDAVASAFSISGGDIKDTLRALFASPEFMNTTDQKITRPSEYLAGLVRALAPDTSYPPDAGQFWFFAQNILGQLPHYWPTPDGYPDQQSYWASTGGFFNRWRLSFLSYSGVIPGVDIIDVDYTLMLAGANTLSTVVDAITDAILMRTLSASDRDTILNWLVSETGLAADQAMGPGLPEQVAALLAAVLISSVYFQLR